MATASSSKGVPKDTPTLATKKITYHPTSALAEFTLKTAETDELYITPSPPWYHIIEFNINDGINSFNITDVFHRLEVEAGRKVAYTTKWSYVVWVFWVGARLGQDAKTKLSGSDDGVVRKIFRLMEKRSWVDHFMIEYKELSTVLGD